jgi:integrase
MRGAGGVYRRGKTWWVHYSRAGELVRESSKSTKREDAVRLLTERQAEAPLHSAPAGTITFEGAFAMLEADYELRGRRSGKRVTQARTRLGKCFAGERLDEITSERLDDYAMRRRKGKAEGEDEEPKAAPATIRYELAVLRRAMRLAQQKGRLRFMPAFPTLQVDNARAGFFEAADLERVIAKLQPDVQPVVRFLALTGWRLQEALSLEWRQVDPAARTITLPPEKSKTRAARVLPYGALKDLAELVEARRKATAALEGRICPWVFHRDGEPIRTFRRQWVKACKEAGVPGRLIHDLRRTAVRRLIRAGAPEKTVMSLVGHKTRSMLDRYHIVATADLEAALGRLEVDCERSVKDLSAGRVLEGPGAGRRNPAKSLKTVRKVARRGP